MFKKVAQQLIGRKWNPGAWEADIMAILPRPSTVLVVHPGTPVDAAYVERRVTIMVNEDWRVVDVVQEISDDQ